MLQSFISRIINRLDVSQVYGNRVIKSPDQRVGWSQSFCRFWWRTTSWWIIIHIRQVMPTLSPTHLLGALHTLTHRHAHKYSQDMPKFFDSIPDENSLENISQQEFVCSFSLTLVRQLQNTRHQTYNLTWIGSIGKSELNYIT